MSELDIFVKLKEILPVEIAVIIMRLHRFAEYYHRLSIPADLGKYFMKTTWDGYPSHNLCGEIYKLRCAIAPGKQTVCHRCGENLRWGLEKFAAKCCSAVYDSKICRINDHPHHCSRYTGVELDDINGRPKDLLGYDKSGLQPQFDGWVRVYACEINRPGMIARGKRIREFAQWKAKYGSRSYAMWLLKHVTVRDVAVEICKLTEALIESRGPFARSGVVSRI